ncbi:probable prolyl 4-hydroxylase 6 [Phragmites australis]|uniref:probable prolyl 4-hydroxylase 6 n=1 Tax=Phragmites australis TaxID=29695 RepID=UPI002D781BC2|nr:probable prolyl 4-hydroxylase 6 [Phragmites australis]
MGSGIGALLVLVAACLTLAPPCVLASSRKFDLSIARPNLVNFTGGPFSLSPRFAFDSSKSKRLSWHPRVFLYEGFLSDMECDYLISMARDKMDSSLVNEGARDNLQNNTNANIKAYLVDSKDTIVSKIEDRISTWSFLPKEYGGSMQILKYRVNKSGYNKDEPQSSSRGDRLVTILMYLSDVKRGGETVFPRSELKGAQVDQGTPSECSGYAVHPVKGNAILLFDLKPDGVIDQDGQYEVCSVLEGEEWLAIKHIHLRKIDTPKSSLAYEDECTDEDDRCFSWATGGECDRNSVFMIGSPDYYGTCRKSCRAC